jgi:predicted ribosome quality control (RQC) complex YloA/Tae2 family protein
MLIKENDDVIFTIGKTCKENWLILDLADDNDIWIHLDNLPSPYVIISKKNKDYTIVKKDIIEGGQYCLLNSKFKKKLKKCKICFIECQFLKKGRATGEVKLLKLPEYKTIKV